LEPDSVLSREQGLHEVRNLSSIWPRSLNVCTDLLWQFGWTQQTLAHLRLPPDTSGPKSENFRVINGVLKNKLRGELPVLREHFKSVFKTALRSEFGTSKTVDYVQEGGLQSSADQESAHSQKIEWSRCWLIPTLFRIITRMNLSMLLGEEQGTWALQCSGGCVIDLT
jgi:hypothetical protein